MVALMAGHAKETLLEDTVLPVPPREHEAAPLVVVRDAPEAVLAPAVDARARVLVREVAPRVAVPRVVLADGGLGVCAIGRSSGGGAGGEGRFATTHPLPVA